MPIIIMVNVKRVRTKCGGGGFRSTWRCFKRHDHQAAPASMLHSPRRGLLFVRIYTLLTGEIRTLGHTSWVHMVADDGFSNVPVLPTPSQRILDYLRNVSAGISLGRTQ